MFSPVVDGGRGVVGAWRSRFLPREAAMFMAVDAHVVICVAAGCAMRCSPPSGLADGMDGDGQGRPSCGARLSSHGGVLRGQPLDAWR